ncbi:MAG: CBS domain-containing protein, partial [Solirubrobacteraceae bacterium]
RGLKRLRIHRLREAELEPDDGTVPPDADTVDLDTSLHDALSVMLANGAKELRVMGDDHKPAGMIRFETIARLLAPERDR